MVHWYNKVVLQNFLHLKLFLQRKQEKNDGFYRQRGSEKDRWRENEVGIKVMVEWIRQKYGARGRGASTYACIMQLTYDILIGQLHNACATKTQTCKCVANKNNN